jgi:long-chain acyl-CoA synthetase
MNVAYLQEQCVERLGDTVGNYFEGRGISNSQMRDRGNMLGNALLWLGVRDGDVVAITMANCPEVLESFCGVFRMGAKVLPLLFLLSADEVRFILEDSEAVAVICDFTQEQKILEACKGLDNVKHIIVLGAQELSRVLDYEALMGKSSPRLRIADKEPGDVAMIMYTSGTTARPKGVLLTHENLIAEGRDAWAASEFTKPITGILCLPLAHIYGVGVLNAGFCSEFEEGKQVIARWFVPEDVMGMMEAYRVQVFPGVPAMFAMLLDHPGVGDFDLSSLEDCMSAAAPLPPKLQADWMEKFGCRIRQLYGLTESAGIGSIVRPSHPFRPGTVGKAYDNMEIKIFDDDDNELPPGENGEVVMRGPHVMKGYHKRPEETEFALRGGWLYTGDIGNVDDEGFLYITARKKDLIIKGGENIMPAQIEDVLCRFPSVAEAAAVGVQHPVYGEEIVAFVTLEPGSADSAEAILDFCSGRLSSFKRPREVRIVEALPKNAIGKVLKRELIQMYEEE